MAQWKTFLYISDLLSKCSNSNVISKEQNTLHAIKERDPIQLCVSIGKKLSNAILETQAKLQADAHI